jgi:hypothetical protein
MDNGDSLDLLELLSSYLQMMHVTTAVRDAVRRPRAHLR